MTWASIGAYSGASLEELRDAGGITQFPSATSFFQIINGLQIQGGITSSIAVGGNLVIPFFAPYETQVLGVFLTPVNAAASYGSVVPAGTNLNQFQIINGPVAGAFYWWAIGV